MSVAYKQLALSALEQIGPPPRSPTRTTRRHAAPPKSGVTPGFWDGCLNPELAARRQGVIESNPRSPVSRGSKTSISPPAFGWQGPRRRRSYHSGKNQSTLPARAIVDTENVP